MQVLLVLLGMLGGVAVGTQASINAALGKTVGLVETAFFSFVVGALCLGVMVAVFGKGNLGAVTSAPAWQLVGGMLGAFYVFVMVTVVPQIGAAPTIMTIIAGQLITGVVVDQFGLFGVAKNPLGLSRAAGVALVAAGVALVVRK